MKKSILNLGKTLNKLEQQSIKGGSCPPITSEAQCVSSGGVWLANWGLQACLISVDYCR